MSIFNIIKVSIDSELNNTNPEAAVSSQILDTFHYLEYARTYISSLSELNVCDNTISVQQNLLNEKPSIKDVDGLYLVRVDESNKYHMYNKTTIELKGYVYNSVDIQITYLGYIEICESKIQCQDSHNSQCNQKNQHKKNKKHSKTVQTNISLTNMSSKKHKKRKMLTETINDGHLNYELIMELKEKLKKIKENREKKDN